MPQGASPQLEDGFTRIANELLEALARWVGPGRIYRLMNAIIRETYGYNEKARKVRRARLAELLGGVSERYIRQLLSEAKDLNMVTVNGWEIGIQKDYSRWLRPEGTPSGFESGRNPFRSEAKRKEPLPVPKRKEPLPPKPEGTPSTDVKDSKDRTSTSTSKATPCAEDDSAPEETAGQPKKKPGPANSPLAQLVQDLWEAFEFAGSPPSKKPAAFSGAMRLADGKTAAARELIAHLNETPHIPEDGDSEAGYFLANVKEHLAAPEGVGWRKGGRASSQQTPLSLQGKEVPDRLKRF